MAEFIDIGFGNIAAKSRIVCVYTADSAPSRRMIQDAKDRGACIDCCAGKKCKAILATDTDLVILSSLEVSEIRSRLE
ncbi:MAG: DUF370 domain-containing protein [Saccharofermentans sp.]|nr:DUF370 domain-containing protein [Saccharofermentans sp.]